MRVYLIAGLWLPSAVWDATVSELGRLGHDAVAIRLPGVDDLGDAVTLDDQLAAVLDAIDGGPDDVAVVGHSAACALAWMVADRRPDRVGHVVLIGGFPPADGETYADIFDHVDGVMPFPGWDPFEGADSADLDEEMRASIAERSVPVPSGVARGTIHLHSELRWRIPVTVVCPEFDAEDVRAWVASGDIPELEAAAEVHMVDIDSGHWPMLTRPADLARLLDRSVSR